MAQAVAPPAPSPAPARLRDPWFDNAKMTLVVLVVIGHAWTLLPLFGDDAGSGTAKSYDIWLYHFLYTWHIPAFVIVTGYLSKSFDYTRQRMMSLLTTVAVPYLVFEAVLVWYRHTFGGIDFKLIWANPHWPMWYLSALFFWRLATPVFTRLPGKVVVAVVVSLAGGLYATNVFDNARILGLLPFFVLGLKMHEGHWNLLRTRRARWYGAVVLLGMFVAARFVGLSMEWFYWRSRYEQIDDSSIQQALVIRLCLLIAGLVGAFAFFAVVPRTQSWFSALGSATLIVYLFHGFFVLGAEFAGYKQWAADHWPLSLVLTTLCAAALAILLGWRPVSSRLNGLVDPVGWVSRRRRARVPSSA